MACTMNVHRIKWAQVSLTAYSLLVDKEQNVNTSTAKFSSRFILDGSGYTDKNMSKLLKNYIV